MTKSGNSAGAETSIWDASHRSLTIGSILAFTILAFQGLALSTIAPLLADDIGGRNLYGWIFSAFLLPQIVGTVFAGSEVDRHSPARVFFIHLICFGIGCVVAGAAPSIAWLFVGRAIQGFGAGGMAACIYAVIASAYEDRLRPPILAATSAAWVVPSMIGPAIAGFVAETWSWRWAFFGLLPILPVVILLTLPAYASIRATGKEDTGGRRLTLAFVLALGTGLFLAGLDLRPVLLGAGLSVAGLAIFAPSLVRLMPNGVLRARPVMPAAVLSRILGFGGFAVVETYLILALKDFGESSAAQAGIILTVASILWTSGSWVQSRWDRARGSSQRPARLTLGFALVLAASAGILLCVAVFDDIWLWVGLVGWSVAGLGIGMAYPTAVSMAFAGAPKGQEGTVSSAMLLGDLFAFSIGVGLGGVLLAVGEASGWGTPPSVALAMSLGVAMLAGSAYAASRTRLPDYGEAVTKPRPGT